MPLIGLLPAIDAALMLVNRGITEGFGATLLPGLELRDGVPPDLRTLVAVPTLLTSRAGVDEQIERLEVHYLANPDGDLHFALLSDWADASDRVRAGDDDLLAAAAEGIARLNARYPGTVRRRSLPAAASPPRLERRRRNAGWAGSASAASCTS